MNPKASRVARVLRRSESQAVFHRPDDDAPVTVDTFAARVWDLADGTRPATAIARVLVDDGIPGVTLPRVWSALDRLSDLGLLEGRVSPPAGAAPTMPRRAAIRHGMAIAAGAASLAITGALATGPVDAQPASPQGESSSKEQLGKQTERVGKQSAEQHAKQDAEQQSKHKHTPSAEQHAKQSAEQQHKQAGEQRLKQHPHTHTPSSEQQAKQSAEQEHKRAAEQQAKRSAEQRSKQR
jgi:hypothetical protein